MTRRALLLSAIATAVACNTASTGEVLTDTMDLDIAAQDLIATNECRCWWQDDGYASVSACLAETRFGELTTSERACLVDALEPYGRFADWLDCVTEYDVLAAQCVTDAACTASAFDMCYASYDREAFCPSTCAGLAGPDLTKCNTEAAALQNDVLSCF